MRRPTGIDFLGSALSALLWYSGFQLIMTAFHVTSAREAVQIPSVTDCGIYFLVALAMHLLLARRVAAVRGWRFWLMPLVTLPMAILLIFLLQWVPMVWSMLRLEIAAAHDIAMQRFAREEAPVLLNVFGSGLYRCLVMMPDLIILMYPFLMANQFIIRVLYRRTVAGCPAHAQAS